MERKEGDVSWRMPVFGSPCTCAMVRGFASKADKDVIMNVSELIGSWAASGRRWSTRCTWCVLAGLGGRWVGAEARMVVWCGVWEGGKGKARWHGLGVQGSPTYRSLLLDAFSRCRLTGRTGSFRRDGRRDRRRRSRVSWSAWCRSGRDWQTRRAPRDCAVEDPCCVLFVCLWWCARNARGV
jgi:hypothetical protein